MQEMIAQESACGRQAGACKSQGIAGAPVPGPCFPLGPGLPRNPICAGFLTCSNTRSCPYAGACVYGSPPAGAAAVFPGPDAPPVQGTCITGETLRAYERKLREDERARSTIFKYSSSVRGLKDWLGDREITRALLLDYRDDFQSTHAVSSVNGMISAINSYLEKFGLSFLKLKTRKVQKKLFRPADREMTMEDYEKLVRTADELGKDRLVMMMQTICATGIRVSELEFITVEAVNAGQAEVTLKGKDRLVAIPKELVPYLLDYAKEHGIASGPIFLTRNGTPVSRKQIWAEMKALGEKAGVPTSKIFPHNLRHLFAQRYYQQSHDIETLSDSLGHASIETTRIYLSTSGEEHRKIVDGLGLIISLRGDPGKGAGSEKTFPEDGAGKNKKPPERGGSGRNIDSVLIKITVK